MSDRLMGTKKPQIPDSEEARGLLWNAFQIRPAAYPVNPLVDMINGGIDKSKFGGKGGRRRRPVKGVATQRRGRSKPVIHPADFGKGKVMRAIWALPPLHCAWAKFNYGKDRDQLVKVRNAVVELALADQRVRKNTRALVVAMADLILTVPAKARREPWGYFDIEKAEWKLAYQKHFARLNETIETLDAETVEKLRTKL